MAAITQMRRVGLVGIGLEDRCQGLGVHCHGRRVGDNDRMRGQSSTTCDSQILFGGVGLLLVAEWNVKVGSRTGSGVQRVRGEFGCSVDSGFISDPTARCK